MRYVGQKKYVFGLLLTLLLTCAVYVELPITNKRKYVNYLQTTNRFVTGFVSVGSSITYTLLTVIEISKTGCEVGNGQAQWDGG